jgi:hypothetical protein
MATGMVTGSRLTCRQDRNTSEIGLAAREAGMDKNSLLTARSSKEISLTTSSAAEETQNYQMAQLFNRYLTQKENQTLMAK